MKMRKDFTFIDLFAGIGGFHCAMSNLSDGKAKCLFASEIDQFAQKVYEDNFGIKPLGDIRQIDASSYDAPDVVCGGFPCQTFSKAGKQDGFKDPRGTLFREIIRIIETYPEKKRPKFLVLENVRNLISHDSGYTWKTIKHEIENIGYNICKEPIVAAPKDVGVPQLRDRAIILAVRRDLYPSELDFKFEKKPKNSTSIYSIVSKKDVGGSKKLTDEQLYHLDCWNDFIKHIDRKIIGFPIWSDEFGKKSSISMFPKWKQDIINRNRKLYENNKKFIDEWLVKWDVRNKFTPTNRKFEWQVSGQIKDIYDGIIQYRTSGIRVKLPTESPALVAMVHLPILGKEKRTISIKEAARLQSFPNNFKFNELPQHALKQLGNAVNVKVIETVFKEFLDYIGCKLED
jgi:DNA (cytosine-5)-methyltransferase 1